MKTLKSHTLFAFTIVMLGLLLPSNQVAGQKAFIGGNQTMPVLDISDYSVITEISGFSSQTRWVQSSSDMEYIYTGTIFFQPDLHLYKIKAETNQIEASLPVVYSVSDLEISEDYQYLFYHAGSVIYKVDAGSMTMVDSIETTKVITYIEVYDNNTVYASSTDWMYRFDFNTHSITDSVSFGTFNSPAEAILSSDKSKIFALKSSLPFTVYVIDLATHELENTVSLSGMPGSVGDIILSPDGSKIYVTSTGSTTLDGSIRVLDALDYSTIADEGKDYGSGAMSFSPLGDLWIPNNTSNTISIFDPVTNTVKENVDTENYLNGPFCVAFAANSTGTKTCCNQQPRIFPNPASKFIMIDQQTSIQDFEIELMDVNGHVILTKGISGRERIDISELKDGLYFLMIRGERATELIRFIKQ